MLYRYNLRAAINGKEIFDGDFSSINQLIKVACNFDEDVVLHAEDFILGNIIPIYSLVGDYKRNYRGV